MNPLDFPSTSNGLRKPKLDCTSSRRCVCDHAVERSFGGSRLTCCITQTKTTPVALTLSPTNDSFAILSLPDLRLTTFTFLTGRLHRAYDESLTAVQEMQQAGTSGVALDSMEFGRRLAVERELEKLSLDAVKEGIVGSSASIGQPVWDESGKFVLYPTLLGIKGESSLPASLPL